MEIKKIRGASAEQVRDALSAALHEKGFEHYAAVVNSTRVDVSGIRVGKKRVSERGPNYHMTGYNAGYWKSPHATNVLAWDDWVEVNDTINDVLDNLKVSANAQTLQGKFRIRDGMRRYTRSDWYGRLSDNVGSMMYPISRQDAVISEQRAVEDGVISAKEALKRRRRSLQGSGYEDQGETYGPKTQFGVLDSTGMVTNAVSVDMGAIASDDPLAYSYGFNKGLRGEAMVDPGEDESELAEAYIEGWKFGNDVREGRRSMPPWARGVTDLRPCVRRKIRRQRGPGPGWWREPKRHARAARLGYARRRR